MVKTEDLIIIIHGTRYIPANDNANFKMDMLDKGIKTTISWKIPENLNEEETADHFNLWAKQNQLKYSMCYPKNWYENYFKNKDNGE